MILGNSRHTDSSQHSSGLTSPWQPKTTHGHITSVTKGSINSNRWPHLGFRLLHKHADYASRGHLTSMRGHVTEPVNSIPLMNQCRLGNRGNPPVLVTNTLSGHVTTVETGQLNNYIMLVGFTVCTYRTPLILLQLTHSSQMIFQWSWSSSYIILNPSYNLLTSQCNLLLKQQYIMQENLLRKNIMIIIGDFNVPIQKGFPKLLCFFSIPAYILSLVQIEGCSYYKASLHPIVCGLIVLDYCCVQSVLCVLLPRG